MKKILITITGLIAAALLFTGGVYANEQGWLSFTGDTQVEESEGHVEEIMNILKEVNAGKISAEEAVVKLEDRVEELEDMNPSGLAKKNKELREHVDELKDDLLAANATNEDLKTTVTGLQSDNDTLKTSNTALSEENENLQATIDLRDHTIQGHLSTIEEHEATIANLEQQLADAPEDQTEYIQHLEDELARANEAVNQHNTTTTEAVEEARGYQDE